MRFAISADQRVNIKVSKKKRQVLRPCSRIKKAVEHESDGDTDCNWCARKGPHRLGKEARRDGN